MRRKLSGLLTFTLLAVIAIFAMMTASADMGAFSMSPIFPDNQNPDTSGFFDLRVQAGTRQEIGVAVNNSGEQQIDVSLSLVTASTNRNGIVNYSTEGVSDTTMAHSLTDIGHIAVGGGVVTVEAGETEIVPIFIDIPEEGFDGIILGSVHALLEITDEQRADAGMIVNRFAHVLVVRLQERDTEIAANFELGEVRADLVNHRASIVAEVRNTQPRLSMGALLHAQIYPQGAAEPIFVRSNVNVDFAPNTIFQFSMIDEAGFGLQAGYYVARIQLEHGGVTWDFDRNFEILPQQAEVINAAAVNIQQQLPEEDDGIIGGILDGILDGDMLLIGGIALLVLALTILIIVLLVRIGKDSSRKRQPEISDEELMRRMELLRLKSEFESGGGSGSGGGSDIDSNSDQIAAAVAPQVSDSQSSDKINRQKNEGVKIKIQPRKGK